MSTPSADTPLDEIIYAWFKEERRVDPLLGRFFKAYLARLDDRRRAVVELHWGSELSLENIATKLGLSRERTRFLKGEAHVGLLTIVMAVLVDIKSDDPDKMSSALTFLAEFDVSATVALIKRESATITPMLGQEVLLSMLHSPHDRTREVGPLIAPELWPSIRPRSQAKKPRSTNGLN